jgi:hypothetical protein
MELLTLLPEQSRTALEQLVNSIDHVCWSKKFDGGPLFRLGDICVSFQAWESIPSKTLQAAIGLHQCGVWGIATLTEKFDKAIDREDGLICEGCAMSIWTPRNCLNFYIQSLEGCTRVHMFAEDPIEAVAPADLR